MQLNNQTLLIIGGLLAAFWYFTQSKKPAAAKPAGKTTEDKLIDHVLRGATNNGDDVSYTQQMNVPLNVTLTPSRAKDNG